MKRKHFFQALLSLLLVTAFGCSKSGSKPDAKAAADAKIDSTYAMLTDLRAEQAKIVNQFFPSAKITDAIKAYADAKTVQDKIRFGDLIRNENEEARAEARAEAAEARAEAMAAAAEARAERAAEAQRRQEEERRKQEEQRKKQGQWDPYEFISLEAIKPERFDLAVKNNDMVIQQLKLMNAYFNELDAEAVSAIEMYEKMSAADKGKAFKNVQQGPIAGPVEGRFPMLQEIRYAYYLNRYRIQQQLLQRLLQRRYLNEFPQGFKQFKDVLGFNDEKQFDLKLGLN